MNIKSIFVLCFLLIFVKSQEPEAFEEDQCFYIYDCCKKVDFECVEHCEPIVRCSNNSTNEILGFELYSEPVETPGVGYQVIAVGCKENYR